MNEKKILAFERPDLLNEWDFEKNQLICAPDEVTIGSHKVVWWKCSTCGHEWSASIRNRVKGFNGCVQCKEQCLTEHHTLTEQHKEALRKKNLIVGKTDLATTFPSIAKEWDFEKNENVTPLDVTKGSDQEFWWKCSTCGHEWKTSVYVRTSGHGCPVCAKSTHSSIPEQLIFLYVHNLFPDTINSYKVPYLKSLQELDVFIPSLNIGIEYDDVNWHSPKKRILMDKNKDQILLEHGVTIIRLREAGCPKLNDGSIELDAGTYTSTFSHMNQALINLFGFFIEKNLVQDIPNIDIDRDIPVALSLINSFKINKSLASTYPQLLKEWNYEKNKNLDPNKVSSGTHTKVWWKCSKCGYEWAATPKNRGNLNSGCLVCSGKVVIKGINDLETLHPNLMEEWDYSENSKLPSQLKEHSDYLASWCCKKCGYRWKAKINERTRSDGKGTGCPLCNGNVVVRGFNDFATLNPDLLKEWNFEKNDISPTTVRGGSGIKVWWKCSECGHEWSATINSRAHKGSGCPICVRKKAGKKISASKRKLSI